MQVRDLFNVRRVPTAPGPGGGAAPGEPALEPRQGAFVTLQSLTSFAGATGVVGLLWRTLAAVLPGWGQSITAAFCCSLVVGAALYLISETDPARGPLRPREYFVDAFVALINILVLFSAAVGATQVASGSTSRSDIPAATMASSTK